MKNLPFAIGISDFKELIESKSIYVDKSLFIQEILGDPSKVILLLRPRRFGKTLNLSMLKYFFDLNDAANNRQLFKGLLIAKDAESLASQGKYPVVFLTLKGIKQQNFEDAMAHFKSLLSALYREHAYLLTSEKLDNEEQATYQNILSQKSSRIELQYAVKALLGYLHKHHGVKPILLMDEYDTPVHESYLAKNPYHNELLDFMKVFLGEALKDNTDLHKAIITGILRIAQVSLFSGVNNLTICSVLNHQYASHFGFTEKEMTALLGQAEAESQHTAIKDWYNGYQIGEVILYNPWSITNCLRNQGQLLPYWIGVSEHSLPARLLRRADISIREQLTALLEEQPIRQSFSDRTVLEYIERDANAVWGLMLFAGYLKVIGSELIEETTYYDLEVPNREVRSLYREIVRHWFTDTINEVEYNQLLRAIVEGRSEDFHYVLQRYLYQSASYHELGPDTKETVYHVFFLGLVAGLKNYKVTTQTEGGLGRSDLLIIPHDKTKHGVILEFKTAKSPDKLDETAQNALNQIAEKHYEAALVRENITKSYEFGVAFHGKECAVVFRERSFV